MKYTLDGQYETNKNIEDLSPQVRKLFDECENSIVNNESIYQSTCSIKKDTISVSISCENISAHELFYRIKKCLSESLGKMRVGIKKTRINKYEITFNLEKEPLNPIKVPLAKTVFTGKTCNVLFENIDEKYIIRNYIDRILNRIKEKVNAQYYEGKEEFWELMEQTSPRDPVWEKDPTGEMVNLNWLKQGPTKGKWFYMPQAAAILNAMRDIVVKEILQPLHFQEVAESNFIPFDIWLETGHLIGVPNEVYYYSEPATRDPDVWEEFKDIIYITREVPVDILKKLVSEPKGGITYAQCPTIYWSLKSSVIPLADLPFKIYENTVVSARYESGGRHGLERTDEFHRIEIVYIGTEKQLTDLREHLIDRYKYIFNKIFDIEWRMAWVTPWYMQQAGLAGVEETDKKIVGTIDFEAYLPYRGEREKDETWLEFQNLTISGNKFTKAFNIKTQKGELWSGCSGIGLERWAVAFLAQKGIDPERWPEKFREYLKDLPKGFRFF